MEFEIYDGLNGDEQFMVKPLAGSGSTGIMLSTLWSQSGVARVGDNTSITYNEYCPFISGSRTHSVTGCTNTAAGQIIYYFIEKGLLDFQLTLDAADAYTDDNGLQVNADGSTPGTVSFSVINSKLADYDINSADDAAALVYACGVVQEADYGSSTATAWSLDLFYRSGFECANRSDSVFWGTEGAISEGGFEVLIENLTAGRVVGTSYPGHALVIDGYDSGTDKFHINYGWGNSTSTRWYTRSEMNAVGYYNFIYDLMPEGEKDLFVTDSRIYGTGTLARALELAKGTKGANTVTVDKSLAGEKLAGNMNFRFKEEITIRNFNMELMTFSSSSYGYGFVSENDAVGIFTDFTGALITVGGNYGYAFSFSSSDRLELSTDQAVIYAGNYRVNGDAGAGAEAVLASLRASQKEDSDVAGFVIDTSQSSYSIFAGAGNDLIVLDNNTIVAGNISLQGGDDTLSVTGGSHVYGDINCSDGSNVITIDSTSSITGCFYGTADLNFVLNAVPDDEASFVITGSVSNLRSNAAITVDVSKATAGKYTLITADSSASYISNLDYIQLIVTAGMQESFALSVNGGADCRYAELLREGNSLVLRVKGYDEEDKTAPAVPASLTASVSGNSVQLDWGDSTDNNRIDGYFFRYGTSASLSGEGEFVTDSEAVISGLENGTWYYQVRAKDGSGNLSNWSTVRSFTVNYTPQYVTLESGGLLVSAAAAMTGKTVSGSGAKMNVSSGGTASRTLVLDGGIQSVSSGGKGSDTKVSSGGFAQILFSGTMKDLTIYESGSAAVLRSGTLSNATVSGGVLHLSSGGAASGVTVKSGGELVLRPNGSARNVTVSQGGTILGFTLLNGTSSYNTLTCNDFSINNAAVKSGTSAFAYSGAKVSNVDVQKGATLYVYSGGSATIKYNPWRGTVRSSGGAYVNYLDADTKVYYGGSAYGILSSGAALNSLTVSYGQEIYVYSGGSASGLQLSGGCLYISGGSTNQVTVNNGGRVYLSQGRMVSTTVNSGGSAILSGGSADDTTVSTGGRMYIMSGADAGDFRLCGDAMAFFSAGASAGTIEIAEEGYISLNEGTKFENIILRDYGSQYIDSDHHFNTLQLDSFTSASLLGTVSSAIVGSRSYLRISSCGAADKITVLSAGRLYFEEGAVIKNSFQMQRGAVVSIEGSASADCDITINGTLHTNIDGQGILDMRSHKLTLDLRERYVTEGCIIDNLANVRNAGLAITVSATQQSGIYEIARSASSFTGFVTINSGSLSGTVTLNSSLKLGNSTYSLSVNKSGFMHLSVENSTTNTAPAVADYIPGTWSTDWAQAANYARENNKSILVFYKDRTTCGGANDMAKVFFKDSEFMEFARENLVLAYDICPAGKSIYGGGNLFDADGNSISNKGVSVGSYDAYMTWLKAYTGNISGYWIVSGNSVTSHSTVSGMEITGSLYVGDATASQFKVVSSANSRGSAVIASGGTAVGASVYSGGVIDLLANGTANDTVIDQGGWMTVCNGGLANSTTVNSGGWIYISNGGTADSTTVNSSGGISISSGGTAGNTQINSGGTLCLLSGASAADAVVNGGFMDVFSSGVAEDTVISKGGYVRVRDFGSAIGTLIESGASMYVHSSNGYAYDTFISGFGRVYDGATMSKVTIASGGSFHLWRGGILKDAEIQYGGLLDIRESSSILTGDVLVAGQLDISYDHKTDFSNADIVVDMSGRTVTDTYSIVNLNYIGETTISIKVADNQARGTYKFASNAALFTDTITIGNGTKDFGTLTIGGAVVEYGDYSYQLVQSGKNLNFVVTASKIPAPAVTADVTTPTNGNVVLTAVFDEFSTVKEYRINGGTWKNYTGAVTVSENSKVEFRCKDAQNVYSDVSVYNVTNIDKVAPVITVTGNTERPARKVILTASADDGSSILYSTDNASWNQYTAPVTVTANGTVFFKSTDAAGNTAQKSVAVSNIDLTLPDAPAVTADVTAPTNGKVTLTIHFSDGVAKKEYSADKRNWQLCSGTIEAAENGTFYFREMDAAGNYSEISSYTVSNIDRAAPDIPAALNIVHSENKWYLDWQDAADKGIAGTTGYYYRYGKNSVLNGSGVFIETSRADITSLEEGRWYFQVQSVDAAGNKSPWTTVFETVIDRTAPLITLDANTETPLRSALLSARVDDGSTIMYSTDRVKWYEYTSTITVTDNGTWYFKSTDAAGNTAQNSITFTNIDHTLPELPVVVPDITAPTRNNVTVSVIFTANAVVPQYSTNGLRWYTYTAPITLTGNTTLYFREKNAAGEYSEIVSYTVSNIDKAAPDIPENLNFVLAGGTLAVKWNDAGDNGSAGVTEYNVRYGSSPALNGQGETVKTNQFDLLNIAAGTWYFQVQSVDAAGNVSSWSEAVAYTVGSVVSALQGSASGVSWKDASGTGNYTVEYSKDNFAHLLSLESSSCGVDTYNVPAGNYRWRVDGVEGPGFTAGEKNSAAIFKSDADGVQDLFFGTAHSLWSKGYAAEHQSSGERIMLAGKNNISDIFEGSSDAAILVLTDDANGDALFVDDIYSALGSQARFARMSEIRTGAGDDIVDMTSERWTYSGSNIRIFGGDGNDVLWGGAESNILSGDAGNDRLAGASGNDILIGGSGNDLLLGGGGDDIFIFGAGWGEDTVEQLTSGSVTLWFESGSSANWNKETLTYSDGECKVSVKGGADVMLKFGDDSSLPENCFDGALTDKVFS